MPPDRELLAAIGQVVVDAAALEYFIAVLVAVIEGRDEEWARKQVAQTGAARRALERLVNGRPDRPDLGRLCQDAAAVLDDRHRIAHSVAVDEWIARRRREGENALLIAKYGERVCREAGIL
jgi:hypothetical protein